MVADEEAVLPFPDGTFDLVISSLSMQWVNNLPGLFSEVSRVLRPDGCFMFAMVGGATLPELRASMVMAELERDGGVSPHVGPFVQLSDVGALLQRAGFALPTIDVDTVNISFPNAAVLMEHLQRMGENNACIKCRDRTPFDVFLATSCIYDELFALKESQGEIEASVQIIYAIGWTPHQSQQQPLERGSATYRIGEVTVRD
jgi:NADH dehydrogenase [ubiquinone] 1 alpha subcomplex assembly factor 5